MPTAAHSGMQVRRFFRGLGRHVLADHMTDVGAMMAFYAVLALFPMIVFVVAIAMLVLPADVIEQGARMAAEAVPPAVRDTLVARITAFTQASHGTFAIAGAALALWGAKGGVSSLMTALNQVFHTQETRSWLRRQLIALAVTVSLAILAVAAMALLLVGPIGGHYLADRFGLGAQFDLAWSLGRWLGAGLLVMLVWAIAYRFLPDTDAPFRIFTPGAFIGVGLWLGSSYAFGLYLGHVGRYEATYGTLGGAIIFLTWLWLSNLALLLGAEINGVLADLRRQDSPPAAKLADPDEHPRGTDARRAAVA